MSLSSPEPLYPFGYGLSYTQFQISDLHIEKEKLSSAGKIVFSVDVKNTGEMMGKEVIQVYVNDIISSVATPVKVLKAFKKVELNPSEIKNLKFEIPCSELGLWNRKMEYIYRTR